jgi:hypothetical protein
MDSILKDLDKTKKLLTTIQQITNVFVTVRDEDMFNEVLKLVLKIMESEYGIFGYVDEDGSSVFAAISDGVWERCDIINKLHRLHKNKWTGNWGICLSTKETIVDNKGPFKVPEGHVKINRSMAVPIVFKGKSIGHFTIANKTTDYTEDDVSLMKWISHWIAPVLNARIQQQITLKQKEDIELRLGKVKNALFDMLNYANMYTIILDENLNIRYINWSLSKALGFSSEFEPIGKCWLDFVPRSFADNVKVIHKTIIDAAEPDKYKEVVSDIISITGTQITVKWFNTKINHEYNWTFSFGLPSNEPLEITEETIRAYYRDILDKDRTMIQSMRELLTSSLKDDHICQPILEG